MKLRNFTLAMLVLLGAGVSCTSDKGETPKGDMVQANFTGGISSRATDILWDVNDAIGIYMLDRTTEDLVGSMYNNRYYTTTQAGDFRPTNNSDIIYFPQNGDEVTFKAYYPFVAGLGQDMIIPVSVVDQTSMPAIDLMTAEHLEGFSKADPDVSLRFRHRLSKATFRLTIAEDVQNLLPQDITLTVKGMKTTGTYDMTKDPNPLQALTVNDASVADLVMPMRGVARERSGIVMPRAAGAGVTFEMVSSSGDEFSTAMKDDLELLPGYKYLFDITLHATEVTVSVTIQDWIGGPTTTYDVLGISTPAGESEGVIEGDQLKVYMQNGNVWDDLRTYTYGANDKWSATPPVYWDDITGASVNLRAALVPRQPAANATQMADIIIADPLSVDRNTGADFTLRHAGSRVTVTLESNVFTAEQLAAATIEFPQYLTGGVETKGVFVPGNTPKDVLIDREDPNDQFAIIQPQRVSSEGTIARVTINGRPYNAKVGTEGFTFDAGTAYLLRILVNESDIAVSARVIPWDQKGPIDFEILEVVPAGQTEGIDVGARMNVYLKDAADAYSIWANFTYAGGNKWVPDNEVYWSDISGPGADLRATILLANKLHPTQLDDYLVADDLNVPLNTPVDFTLRHPGSKLTVKLISDTYSQAQLDAAAIVLPQYKSGATITNGTFLPGQGVSDITLFAQDTGDGDTGISNNTWLGLIQPQNVTVGTNMFKVTIGTRDYWAVAPAAGFTYAGGTNYAITIHVNEENVTISAKVIDWDNQSFDLNAIRIGTALPGASAGFTDGQTLQTFTGTGGARTPLTTFTYSLGGDTWTGNPVVYWENIPTNSTFYAQALIQPKLNGTQLDDYIVADPVTPAEGDPVNFTLRHKAAKVMVQLRSTLGTFTNAELANMTVTLPDYDMGGDINNGQFEFPAATTGDIEMAIDGNSMMAVIRPQIVSSTSTIAQVYDPATGRTYDVTSVNNINFAQGMITTLTIDMEKSPVVISADHINWIPGATFNLTATPITVGGSLGQTSTFFNNKTIHTYKLGSGFKDVTYSYLPTTPGGTTYQWGGSETLYWNDLNGQPLNMTGVYYPAQALIPDLNSSVTTFPWNIPANQSTGYGDYELLMDNQNLSTPEYVNFVFRNVLSKVQVKLAADPNEFTADELQAATVRLNMVVKGSASLTTASATGSNTREMVAPFAETDGSYTALVMPQTAATGTTVVMVQVPGYNTVFEGKLTTGLNFKAGEVTTITVTLKKTEIVISATVEPWTPGDSGSIIIQ